MTRLEGEVFLQSDCDRAYPFDWNGDGNDELLLDSHWQGIRLFDPFLKANLQSNWDKTIYEAGLIDYNCDSIKDAVFYCHRDSTLYVYGIPGGKNAPLTGEELFRMQTEHKGEYAELNSAVLLEAAEDLNLDGITDFLSSFLTYQFNKGPRKVVLYDGEKRNVQWEFCLGPGPQHFSVANTRLDSSKIVLFVGQAYDNGRCCQVLCDSSCYLFGINSMGGPAFAPVWLGDSLTYADYRMVPFGLSADPEIVLASYTLGGDSCEFPLVILNAITGRVVRTFSGKLGFSSLELLSADSISAPRILACRSDGVVQLLDYRLELLREDVVPSRKIKKICSPVDFDDDGNDDIPLILESGGLLILNDRFDSVYFYQAGVPLSDIVRINSRETSRLLYLVNSNVKMQAVISVSRVGIPFTELVPPAAQVAVFGFSLSALLAIFIAGRRRRQSNAFLSSIFEDSSRMILGVDGQGRIFRSNGSANQFFAITTKDTNHDFGTVMAKKGFDALAEQLAKIPSVATELTGYELQVNTNGSPRDYWIQMKRILFGSLKFESRTIVSIQDITDRKQFDRYETLSNFSEQMVHDIRKPLSPILLRLQELEAQLTDGRLPAEDIRSRFIRPTLDQIQLLSGYVTRLWDAFRARESERERLDLKALLRFVVKARASLAAPATNIELSVADNLPPVSGRFDDICRVISELIDNALDALRASTQGEIVVEASCTHHKRPSVIIVVSDNGPGIDESIKERIFDLNVSSKESSHHGLGLFIVRKIVLEHGGAISVESSGKFGTRFVVTLPGMEEDSCDE
ncbi:MAG: HAMP domain-containing histidine kinase [candidate division Zixibacteria bacterium]|nr:HAMP domain-containing histidine kinase [candidate division Zixibacteria bacterium]